MSLQVLNQFSCFHVPDRRTLITACNQPFSIGRECKSSNLAGLGIQLSTDSLRFHVDQLNRVLDSDGQCLIVRAECQTGDPTGKRRQSSGRLQFLWLGRSSLREFLAEVQQLRAQGRIGSDNWTSQKQTQQQRSTKHARLLGRTGTVGWRLWH